MSAGVIRVMISRCDHPGFKVALNPMTGNLMKRGEDTDIGKRSCSDDGRNWGDEATSQGYLEPQKLEEMRQNPSLELSEGVWPCQHLYFVHLVSRSVRE